MEHGYKHFSHSHNLVMHQLPEGVDVSCSGCNSSGNGTVFVCWQCKFFLHDQCYRATRSLKHPSHPPHPLTLVPYPTYPSNSFYCNSCEIIGTGFSYSCAHCEFDLHIQCAHSISRATGIQKTHQYPTNYYNPDHQEIVPPSWNGQNSGMAQNLSFHSLQHPLTAAQNPYMDPNSHPNPITSGQYHFTGQNLGYVFIPPGLLQDSNAQNPSTTQNWDPLSISNSAIYPSMAQTGPSVSIPTSCHNLVITSPQYPIPPTLGVASDSVSIPNNTQNPISSDQNVACVAVPDYHTQHNHVESGQNQVNKKGIMHFSHPHGLCMVNLQDKENKVACSGCEKTLDGKGYSCVEPNCNFHLHESCFHLKREIQHKSHPEHPLTLLSSAPYSNKNGEFTCNACSSDGTGFTYHCCICKFDLHIQCASLPETVKRNDHEHMLKLYYCCPVKGEEYTFFCDVCHVSVQKDCWTYYCESCDYGTHLGCVDREECVVDGVLDTQVQLQRLQLQMEMTRQHAQMIASMGASILSLV